MAAVSTKENARRDPLRERHEKQEFSSRIPDAHARSVPNSAKKIKWRPGGPMKAV
jgi:hypothetical protein